MPLRGSQRGGVFRRHPRGEDPQGYLLDLGSHIVETKAAHFDPSKFDDRYEDALKDLLRRKQEGQPIELPEWREPAKVINLMDALRRTIEANGAARPGEPRVRQSPNPHPEPPPRQNANHPTL